MITTTTQQTPQTFADPQLIDALRAQIAALEAQVRIQAETTEDFQAQQARLNDLARRVDELVAALGALRTERDTATEETAQARNEATVLRNRITTQERNLQIAGLRGERAQLLQQLAEFDRSAVQTQALFGGAGIGVGAFWGAWFGPVGALIGAALGGLGMIPDAEAVIQRDQPARARIAERIRQIDLELLRLGN